MHEVEIYTVGGGYYLFDIFNYLAAFTSSGNFNALLYGAICAGALVAAFQMTVFGSVRNALTYFIGTMIIVTLGVGPKARVVIMDSTEPLGIYGTVDNVPWSVAVVGSFSSRTGYALTRQLETLLAAPDDLTYQNSGMMFGATIVSQAARWRAVTPVVQESLVNFLQNCMVDGSMIGIVDTGEMSYTGDLESFISNNAPQSLAFYDPVLEATTTCATGWPALQNRMNVEVQNILNQKAAARFARAPGANLPAAVTKVSNTLSDFQNFIGMTSGSATTAIRQTMLIISMDESIQRLIASSGNDAAMTAYQAARTEAQTRASYNSVGMSALKWVPLLKIAFECIYYAAFPLAMVMMMTPLVWSVMKGYFGGFIWLAAWDPLSAILHSVLMKASSGYYREAMGSYSNGSIDYVLSYANQFGVRAVEQDVGSVAGYLMMSVPFLATVIMFGASRMAGMATSMLNVSQGASIETGREAATGNLQLANASMNNFAANKWNTSSLRDTGINTVRLPSGSLQHENYNGSTTYSSGTALSTGGMSARIGQTIREEVSDRKDEAIRTADSSREEWSTAVNHLAADYADFGRQLNTGTSINRDNSAVSGNRQTHDAREAHNAVESFADEHGITVDAAYRLAIAGEAAGKLGKFGAELKGELKGDAALTGIDADRYGHLATAARENGLSETVSRYAEAVKSIRTGEHSTESNIDSGGKRWSMEDVRRHGETYAEAREEAITLSAAESALYSRGISYDGQLSDAIQNEWRENGFSEQQIDQWLHPQSVAGVKQQEQAVEGVLPGLLQELGLDRPNPDLVSAFTLKRPEDEITVRQLPDSGTAHRAEYERRKAATVSVGDAIENRRENLAAGATAKAADTERTVIEGQDFGAIPGAVLKAGTTVADIADSAGDLWNFGSSLVTGKQDLTYYDRDAMIRTIAGEAGQESATGQAAVAHVIMNRVADQRWGDNPAEVSLQLQQFSAWNSGTGGNGLPEKIEEGSPQYERIGRIVDAVAAGEVQDPTGGATHYYSPKGMQAHIDAGEQSNRVPTWLTQESQARGGNNVQIGGHVFTGKIRGE
ncbi:conjugal transfer protein TraG N-terminal domain-containing protein [uncultured Tateyamaria sp.]|uniref:conjugal transfer protein TraG N-terminal domain-containing protein n=1 Tax=uncultured Tateyamaria sp. TaxID=455651 RepID=UPI00261A4A32|nr:conjugal transfer protein TraG N-terminal domain-containing protein [uncultured Tateyamaria sp.]